METSNAKSKCMNIAFSSSGFSLSGVLHLPDKMNPPIVIGSHGLLANKNSPKQLALAQKCNELGIAYFRFDYRGCGASQGDYTKDTSLKARCEDLTNIINLLQSRNDIGNRIGLFGSSFGGTVSIATAAQVHIDSLVTFAAPVRSSELSAPNDLSLRSSETKLQFDIADDVSAIKNILIIHGEHDTVVPLSHAHEIHQTAHDPKKLIIQKNGDHPMSNERHQKEFLDQASNWLKVSLTK